MLNENSNNPTIRYEYSIPEIYTDPFRSEDPIQDFFEIIIADCEKVYKRLDTRGLVFLFALVTVLLMSIVKAFLLLFYDLKKPVNDYAGLKLVRNMNYEDVTSVLARRESVSKLKNQDKLCPSKKDKDKRVEIISKLRNYLYQHDLTLRVTVLKTVKHRRTEEEMAEMYRTGEITKPLSTTYATFGEVIDLLLNEIFENSIDLKRNRITKETYIKIPNDDFLPLKKRIENLYNEQIKLVFD